MTTSQATSPDQYLDELPDGRRHDIAIVRDVILANLPAGIEESMNWGMLTYEVPLSVVPDTYNGQPLAFAGLASQKNHMSVYLSGIYASESLRQEFERRYAATGMQMDIGKSCVRFRKLDDLPLAVIAWAISAVTLEEFVDTYLQARQEALANRVTRRK